MTPAPPKPWERSTGASATVTPSLPAKPAEMTSSISSLATSTDTLPATSNALGMSFKVAKASTSYSSPYQSRLGLGYGSSLGYSPYSRLGGYGSYGSYGGYGGGYGSFAQMLESTFMATHYGPNQPGAPPSLTQQFENSTSATFAMLHSIVSAFGGFAQMLESTFMATHSSFFAMIGVAEQFGMVKEYLGQILSIFAFWRWFKTLRGNGGEEWSMKEFKAWEEGKAVPALGSAAKEATKDRPKVSKKPLFFFLVTVIGLPYLMSKLIRLITASQEAEARRRAALGLPPQAIMGPDGQPLLIHPTQNTALAPQSAATIDPSKLTFVRATHAYTPASEEEGKQELAFSEGDVIAVLTPAEERTIPGWWRGRTREGRVGWFPSTHAVEVAPNKAREKEGVEDAKVAVRGLEKKTV
ncbi:hypothetical protein BT69DRAFT_1271049 [Atractiella rhizophila]|nr:hypothetical protein BT69DRAFT_1271049 [Atractiella rhizophila]